MTPRATQGRARAWAGASQPFGNIEHCQTHKVSCKCTAAKAPSRGEGRARPGQAGHKGPQQ